MEIEQIKEKLKSTEYNFLRTNPHLGNNIILLGLGGSYAYGTNVETSDIDVRGCFLNNKMEILLGNNSTCVTDSFTDTILYSFNKMFQFLTSNNPNALELFGCLPEHYLYISDIGRELLNNKRLFLSKKCILTFQGYALSQLKTIERESIKYQLSRSKVEKYMMNAIRLYMMGIDVLEKQQIITYRYAEERNFLISIRNGEYLNEDGLPTIEFYGIVGKYQTRFEYAKEHTDLPDNPDYKGINEFLASVNERIVKGEI